MILVRRPRAGSDLALKGEVAHTCATSGRSLVWQHATHVLPSVSPYMPIYDHIWSCWDAHILYPCIPNHAHIWRSFMSSEYDHIWSCWDAHILYLCVCQSLFLLCPYMEIWWSGFKLCWLAASLWCHYDDVTMISPKCGDLNSYLYRVTIATKNQQIWTQRNVHIVLMSEQESVTLVCW